MKGIIVALLGLVCVVNAQPRRSPYSRRIPSPYTSRWRNYMSQDGNRGVRNYAEEKNHRVRNRRMGTMFIGPNVCTEGRNTYCCPGWTAIPGSNRCMNPLCDSSCGEGICIRPNKCLCPTGVVKTSCGDSLYKNGDKCRMRCMNGGSCEHNRCNCADGYTGAHCGQPICGPGCMNGGRCINRNKCLCLYGFTGDRCETDYRVGPCFLHRTNDTCMDEVPDVTCHKKLCCATIGQGWGIPCEECAARVGNCSRGRMPPNCDDINECKLIPGLCKGGECINTEGSFRCECPAGYTYNRYLHVCEDINECLQGYCEDGECQNTDGAFICHCPVNYILSSDGTYCIYDAPGYCYTMIESGMCAGPLPTLTRRTQCCCATTGELQQETLGKCFAIPDLSPERCPTLGTPEYAHQCPVDEIRLDNRTGDNLCLSMGENVCANGVCEGTATGDYLCRCDDGYTQGEDTKHCVDINECSEDGIGNGACGMHATCMNTLGSYKCICDRGFQNLSPLVCIDIDECTEGGEDVCQNGRCINTKGSFRCICDEGYRPSATQLECEDINECIERNDLCEHGRCINIVGAFKCVCNDGFYVSEDEKSCRDKNECEVSGMCLHGTCSNLMGGFQCICDNGYELTTDGGHCVDIDECEQRPCINGRCENTEGGFVCHCHRFQTLDETGRVCVLDQTKANCYRQVFNGQCSAANALDILTTRSHCCCSVPGGTSAWGECEPCPEVGSENYAVLCSKVVINDACSLQENACPNGECINMDNNDFRCRCNRGFKTSPDEKSCLDIDECSDQAVCSNGECVNTPGSFYCICNEGFLLSGDVCEDVDECTSNPCIDGDCVNTPGSFVCECDENSALGVDKLHCYNIQKQQCWSTYTNGTCADNFGSMSAEKCCNSKGAAWGDKECISCDEIELKCPKGYEYDVSKDICKDIEECSLGICDQRGTCIETEGSFRIICPANLTLDDDGCWCIDLRMGQCFFDYNEETNECLDPSRAPVMRKADCCCTVGKSWGDPCEGCPVKGSAEFEELCKDTDGVIPVVGTINECILYPDLCENGLCVNTADSFVCDCYNGFVLDPSGRQCDDINECDISESMCGGDSGACINVDGSFQCVCEEGYQLNADENDCIDIDECLEGGRCTGGSCHNTDGSYECSCPDGRSLNANRTRCVDIDECAVTADLCKPYGQCVNMLNNFLCICDEGFVATEDGHDCVDVDECATKNGRCTSICVNSIGSYECRCEDGFTLTYDGHTCADVDECIVMPNRCDGGRCENIEGSFMCECFDGFMATRELDYCNDIDECAMNPNICIAGLCHNNRGSYTCNCDPGYCVPQGQMICVDEDECELGKHTCDVNADCANTDGSFECSCISGFEGDGIDCDDIDECAGGTHSCDPNAECENTLGSYECHCSDGFHGDGLTCSDKDDCLADENLCGPHGQCLNIQGSFECECPMGFMTTTDKKACKDIDECAIEHVCENGRCHNVPGTFRCDCLRGFEKDEEGTNCTDINECDDVTNCINGECVNTIGNYDCQCPEGFIRNPTKVGCVDTRIGDCFLNVEGDENAAICTSPIGVSVARSSCCCSAFTAGWGNPCEFCPERNTTEYMTLCPGGDGFRPNPITVFLEDIDECMELPGLCQGGKCVNVFGSFTCICPDGYSLNETSRVCEDVDECSEAREVCGPGTCVNSVGAYNCLCPDGYISIEKGRKCKDMRVANCYQSYNASSLQCLDSLAFNLTKYDCCCTGKMGQGWNIPCEVCPDPVYDSDEFFEVCGAADYVAPQHMNMCERIPSLCAGGECINDDSEDGYRCECPGGHRYSELLKICEDIDECFNDDDVCVDNAACINTKGSYRCVCADGFQGKGDELCEDIDECDNPLTCANGICENAEGGYICDCNTGFQPINGDEACDDVNECEFDPCGPGTCQNMFGSYMCACDRGYTLSDNGDCVDEDECASGTGTVCKNGVCDNKAGSFECICDEGYKQSEDGRSCLDINECAEDKEVCGVGTCTNMGGSYKCFCPRGYTNGPNGTLCEDENECDILDMCRNGECLNTPGSFSCICPSNFILSSNKKHCIDQTRGQCFREIASGTCSEPMPTEVTRSSCCCRCSEAAWGETTSTCSECPKPGTPEFEDICPLGCGTDVNGRDINECLVNNPCKNGKCVNLAGGYRCECRAGFTLREENGWHCVDENECTERSNPCGAGSCVNSVGGFECTCDPGYYNGPEMNCIDIDECQEPTHGCKFRCVNTDGSYKCICPEGFALNADGRSCDDVNECLDPDLNTCDELGMICKNEFGHHVCNCQPGFRKIGLLNQCENIDECQNAGVCNGGECIDLDGSYKCRCFEGYEYDEMGRRCIDKREGVCFMSVHQRVCETTAGSENLITKTECCCGGGAGWGPSCDICPPRSSKEFTKLCPHGLGFTTNGEDIDDCAVQTGLCRDGTCQNLLGSYKCICNRGYMPTENMQACVDIDECLMANGCAGGSKCRNTIGGYNCECPPGYQITNTMRCVDIDECSTKSHSCQFICINNIGSYSCGCPDGFSMHMNESCVDKDECKMDPDICGKNAECVNDVGGYHCVCAPGFEKTENGDGCVGLPCDAQPGVCGNQMCMNMGGGIRCVPGCNPHMRLQFNPMRCYDINDCRANPCRGGVCMRNERGEFRCGCNRGFAMRGSGGCSDINECQFQGNPCNFGCQNSYGGYRCGCPRPFFGLGGGQCMSGYNGFQQQRYQPPPPQYNPYGGPRNLCYGCPPMGQRRQKRSADVGMEDIHEDDVNAPPVNTSVPIVMHLNRQELTNRMHLIQLIPSLRSLVKHTKYHIKRERDGHLFKMHKKPVPELGEVHYIHLAENVIEPGRYHIGIEVRPSVEAAIAAREALDSDEIKDAMINPSNLDIEFNIE